MKDYYYILGVDVNCSGDDVKNAYRKLSKKFHPDVNQNDSYFESRFKEIQEAYETLSDPLSRKRYDAAFNNTNPPPRPNGYAPPRPNQEAAPKQKYYPRTTAIDVVFTIVLISITVLFGNYVWNAVNGSTTLKTIKPATTATVPPVATTSTHHKRKKHLFAPAIVVAIPNAAPKNKPVPVKPSSPTATGLNNTFQKSVAKSNTEKINNDTFKLHTIQTANHPFKPAQANNDNESSGLPYSSYLRSNITGVINMHAQDSYNSGVVAVIPANSKVTVLAKGINYYKVRFNNDIGYVPAWTVKTR